MPPAKKKKAAPDLVKLVEQIAKGNWVERDRALTELPKHLDTKADFTAASARAVEFLPEESGPALRTLLAVVDRAPPADWDARVEALFNQAEKAKTLGARKRAVYLLTEIGGECRWADPLPNLHPRDLWPRLHKLAATAHAKIREEVNNGITWGLRACPDRAFAEQFAIKEKLWQTAVDWAWLGEDTRALMDRMFAAGGRALRAPSAFTIAYELQHGRAATAHAMFERLPAREQGEVAQELALYGKRIQPVATMIEWIGMLLRSPNNWVRFRAAESACERVEQLGQDIGPIIPALGAVMDGDKLTGENGWAVWWAVAALAITARRVPRHRAAVLAEFDARLTGKAIPRQAAGHGLALSRMIARDIKGVRALLDHTDSKVCVGAIMGMYEACRHMHLPNNMHDFKKLIRPLMPRLKELTTDPRKDVAAAAKKVWDWL